MFDLFSRRLDLFGVPRRSFFALLAHFATDPAQSERLMEFGSASGSADLLDYATRPRRTHAEVLLEFPSARPPLAYYLDLIPPLRERYFSIASSPMLHPTSVHITVAAVRFQTRIEAPRFGVCSTFLASRAEGDAVANDGARAARRGRARRSRWRARCSAARARWPHGRHMRWTGMYGRGRRGCACASHDAPCGNSSDDKKRTRRDTESETGTERPARARQPHTQSL